MNNRPMTSGRGRAGFRLPIRSWEALDESVQDLSGRLARLEGKVSVLLVVLGLVGLSNAAALALMAQLLQQSR